MRKFGSNATKEIAAWLSVVADYLLDTSFLIDYFNEVADGKIGSARVFRSRTPRASRLFVSVVSLAELLEGAEDARELERELNRLAHLLGVHSQQARKVGLMQRRARTKGTRMGENDAWIAATATLASLILIGDDDRAFSNRPGLRYCNFHGPTS